MLINVIKNEDIKKYSPQKYFVGLFLYYSFYNILYLFIFSFMGNNFTVINYSNNSFKKVFWERDINLDNSFKLIHFWFQYFIEEDKWFWLKKLFMSEIIDNYQNIDSVFLDNSWELFMDWFNDRFNYRNLKWNKTIKSNIKLLLFVEDSNNNLFQINCAFTNNEYLDRFFGWDYSKNFKLSTQLVQKWSFSFYVLKLIWDNTNFNPVNTKNDIDVYISKYNEKYNIYNVWLSAEIEDDSIKWNNNEDNLVEIDESGFWIMVNGVSYEIYQWKIVKSSDIEEIERLREKYLFNNISNYE